MKMIKVIEILEIRGKRFAGAALKYITFQGRHRNLLSMFIYNLIMNMHDQPQEYTMNIIAISFYSSSTHPQHSDLYPPFPPNLMGVHMAGLCLCTMLGHVTYCVAYNPLNHFLLGRGNDTSCLFISLSRASRVSVVIASSAI